MKLYQVICALSVTLSVMYFSWCITAFMRNGVWSSENRRDTWWLGDKDFSFWNLSSHVYASEHMQNGQAMLKVTHAKVNYAVLKIPQL